MRRAWIAIGLLIPFAVSALEYRDLSKMYLDAPFSAGEAAGISLLTGIGAVQGDPDGNFSPRRTLNRAEFLKIALASFPKIRVSTSDADDCFPDVPKDAWFSQYVCLAKRRGMVGGYPDGTFKPARSVNYAEALKILGELYDYVAYSGDDEPWYMGYVRAAEFHKTELPIALAYDMPLTRGQMARLAAAYRAEYEGELATYRLAEIDLNKVIAMQKSSVSSSSSSASVTSVSSVTSVTSVSSVTSVTSSSSFSSTSGQMILLGQSAVIGDASFTYASDFNVRSVTVTFRNEPKNLAALKLIAEDGSEVATLSHDTYDQLDRTWKAQGSAVTGKVLPGSGARLRLKLTTKARESGGFAEELIQVKTFNITAGPVGSGSESAQVIGADTHFPAHQTVQAEINVIDNLLGESENISAGNTAVAEFVVGGNVLNGAVLRVEQISFTLSDVSGVSFSNWRLFINDDSGTPCSPDSNTTVLCPSLQTETTEASGSLHFWLQADVALSEENPQYRIGLGDPGYLSVISGESRLGAIIWSDGTGHYQWIDLPSPLLRGTEWK